MEEEVNQIMFDITNPYLRRIVHNILKKYQEAFFSFLQRNVITMRLWWLSFHISFDVTPC